MRGQSTFSACGQCQANISCFYSVREGLCKPQTLLWDNPVGLGSILKSLQGWGPASYPVEVESTLTSVGSRVTHTSLHDQGLLSLLWGVGVQFHYPTGSESTRTFSQHSALPRVLGAF